MARDLNKVQLIGHVGLEPDARYLTSGKAVCNMRLATSQRWRDADGDVREETTWHNLVAWERLAEVANTYVRRGSRIYVEGRLQTRSWDDPDTGARRSKTEVLLSDLILLSPRDAEAGAQPAEGLGEEPPPAPEPTPAPPAPPAPPRRPPVAAAPADEPAPAQDSEPPFPAKGAGRAPARQRTPRSTRAGTSSKAPSVGEDMPF